MGQTSDNSQTLDSSTELENVSPRRPLSNPWTRGQLIVDLATGEVPQTELATRYGVHKSAITQFKKRYQTEIDARRERIMDEYQDLWIADKKSRLAARQVLAEELGISDVTPRTAEVIDKLLNSAADELGELQPKNEVTVNVAEYRITGIDLDKL